MKKRNYRLFMKLLRESAGWFSGAALLTVLSVFLGFLTPAVLAEVLDHVLGGQPTRMPGFIAQWMDAMGGREYLRGNLWLPGVALVAISLLNGVSSFLRGRWTAQGAEKSARTLRDGMYAHLQELPFSYHTQAATGDLVQRCTTDVDTVRRFLSMNMLSAVEAVMMVAIALALMLPISARITLVSLIIMPALFLFAWFFFRLIIKAFRQADEQDGVLTTVLQENLTGVRVVRAFGQAQKEVEKYEEQNAKTRDKFSKLSWLDAIYWSAGDLMGMAQTLLTLLFCLSEVRAGRITVGDLVVFTSYVGMLLWPVRNLGRILSMGGRTMVSLERIDEVLRQKEEEDLPGAVTPELKGDIVFDRVTFRYDGGADILKDLSFTVKAGQTVAILGATGSGKSTIALLLQRLYAPQSGTITLSGHDIKTIARKHLRRRVGLVLQEPFLYSKTIYDNLRMAAPDATREQVLAAAEDAQALEFIEQSDKGWDTLVGERGVTLSGGQKQRAAIARTLLKDSDILIFDDSLSAVDTETDARIREALRRRSRGVTTLIISHRVLTLRQADLILVLEDGRVRDQGSHEELIARPGLYQRIHRIQAGLEDELGLEDRAAEGSLA
ncbi:MAG: ABC transporter ATP-binding protein [Clostridiales bacterium]|mgnify:CR=1 FL=1|nr:ABC transporter ATP-binding protein [Clostridiales bacterium]